MLAKMKAAGQAMIIVGDGRHDSMGHNAKYCAYTVFCCTIPLIIDFSLVQVWSNISIFCFKIVIILLWKWFIFAEKGAAGAHPHCE